MRPRSNLEILNLVFGLSLTLAGFFLSLADTFAQASLGGHVIHDETLYFGGSFSPPTIEHLGLITNLMGRFGFRHGVMDPTVPYKAGAAPA